MKIYLNKTVLEAARERVSLVFDEFENVVVGFSGGKDSTVTLNLALAEAEKRGRLPLKVAFIDQEAEWEATIEHVREVMDDPRIEPVWLQCEIKISNSASTEDEWLYCWKAGEQWLRDKEPDSYHENVFGTDRFKQMFDYVMRYFFKGEKAVLLGGVRAEESPARSQGLTSQPTYKWVTWGKKLTSAGEKEHYALYPIYDWSFRDVWKFINDHNLPYCRIYDLMYKHGVPISQMRVSNLHHETAVKSLYYMQEIEPQTWEKLVARLGGVHSARHLDYKQMFKVPDKVPWMFRSWQEYRDYLLEHLITNEEHREIYRNRFKHDDELYGDATKAHKVWRAHIATLLANDFHLTKIVNLCATPEAGEYVRWKKGKPVKMAYAGWIPKDKWDSVTWKDSN